jgi:hypothetical protein
MFVMFVSTDGDHVKTGTYSGGYLSVDDGFDWKMEGSSAATMLPSLAMLFVMALWLL